MRTKRTILNLLFSVTSLLVSSLMSMLLTRTVLLYLGSDYNGLNGTVSHFLSVLLLFESGFTVAALVKLYKPFGDADFSEINRILSKTKKKFEQIGIMMLLFGTITSAIYSLFIKSDINYFVILLVFCCSVASTAFNFAYTYKYRLLFQVSQKEYIIHIINIVQYLIMYSGMIAIARITENIVLVRAFFLLMNVLSGIAIGVYAKREFAFVNYKVECEDVKIEGTKDLLVSKLVGILYNSLTFLYMSIFVGTVQTSIYAVYNSVISIVNNFTNMALSSPRNALGQIINTEEKKLKKTLVEYEYLSVLIASILLSVTMALYVPFVRIYTSGVNDVDYIRPDVALLLVLITVTQVIHIPSGICIEVSGKFKVVKYIQLITFITLVVFSTAGALLNGLIGLLLAKLLTNVVLAVLEIGYTHMKIANETLKEFLIISIPNIAIAAILAFVEYRVVFSVNLSLLTFIFAGASILVFNSIVLLLFGRILYPDLIKHIVSRVKNLIPMRR